MIHDLFEAAVKGAYSGTQLARARAEGRVKLVPYDPNLKAYAAWDLGVGQNLAIGIYQRVGAETHKIDYWQGSEHDGIPEAIGALKATGPASLPAPFVLQTSGGSTPGVIRRSSHRQGSRSRFWDRWAGVP